MESLPCFWRSCPGHNILSFFREGFVITVSLDLKKNHYISFYLLFLLLLLDFLCTRIIKVTLQNMSVTLRELVQTRATFWMTSKKQSLDVFHGCCSYRCSHLRGPAPSSMDHSPPSPFPANLRFNNILLNDVRDSL